MEYTIIPARKSDAPIIADVIMNAVGEEITLEFAGEQSRIPLVKEVFTRLASMEDSQYSYTNTLVAEDNEGTVVGAIICYDGARLRDLRPAFVKVANEILNLDIKDEDFIDETTPDEIYLDSLCVFPGYRGNGIATRLIEAAGIRHADSGKPLGLLVDPDNPGAKRLYEHLGFNQVGNRPFAGIMMIHMQR